RKCERRADRAASYARRFAAKEACSKALGTGFRDGVYWRDLGVVNLPSGKPAMRLTGGALLRLGPITPPRMASRLDVTLAAARPPPPPGGSARPHHPRRAGRARLKSSKRFCGALDLRGDAWPDPAPLEPKRRLMRSSSARKFVAKKKSSGGIVETAKTIVYAVL